MTDPAYMDAMQRDDAALSPADLVEAYARGPDDLRAAVAGLTREQALARPVPGRWSTVQVVSHLAGAEVFFTDRIERTIALERPLLVATDERPYPERIGFQELDLEEELALFTALRRHLARVLRRQPPDAWARAAVHTETGLVTLRQLVQQPVRHLRHHLPFLAEKRAALGLPPVPTRPECDRHETQ